MVKIILFFVSIFSLLLSSCGKLGEEKQIHTNLANQKEITKTSSGKFTEEKKDNAGRKAPYIWCKWEKRTWAWLEVWVQNCKIKGKKLTINPSKTLPWYFFEIDSGSWFVAQRLAIQVFNTSETKTIEESLEKVFEKIKSQNEIDKNKCKFKKEETLSGKDKEIYILRQSGSGTTQTGSICWDYWYIIDGDKKYFEIFKNKLNKVLFINQTKEKQLFDEKNIKILN